MNDCETKQQKKLQLIEQLKKMKAVSIRVSADSIYALAILKYVGFTGEILYSYKTASVFLKKNGNSLNDVLFMETTSLPDLEDDNDDHDERSYGLDIRDFSFLKRDDKKLDLAKESVAVVLASELGLAKKLYYFLKGFSTFYTHTDSVVDFLAPYCPKIKKSCLAIQSSTELYLVKSMIKSVRRYNKVEYLTCLVDVVYRRIVDIMTALETIDKHLVINNIAGCSVAYLSSDNCYKWFKELEGRTSISMPRYVSNFTNCDLFVVESRDIRRTNDMYKVFKFAKNKTLDFTKIRQNDYVCKQISRVDAQNDNMVCISEFSSLEKLITDAKI